MDTAPESVASEGYRKGHKPKTAFKKGCKGNPGGLVKLSDAGGAIDVLAEMQYRLDHPNERPTTPMQKLVVKFIRTNFEGFIRQYTELKAARANEDLARSQAVLARAEAGRAAEADAGTELPRTEADEKIEEAIARVYVQLESLNEKIARGGV